MDPFVIIVIVLLLGFVLWIYFKNKKPTSKTTSPSNTPAEEQPSKPEQPKTKRKSKSKASTPRKKVTKKKKTSPNISET